MIMTVSGQAPNSNMHRISMHAAIMKPVAAIVVLADVIRY